MAGRKGVPGSGGIPLARAAAAPHPGGQVAHPAWIDGIDVYERRQGTTLRRVPERVERAEPLLDQLILLNTRAAGVAQIMGNLSAAYTKIVHGDYGDFLHLLSCVLTCPRG